MRKSGILMHISSLPNPYGIGSMGKCSYDFIDFLQAAGQKYWQVLPLCPTGYGDSPYQAFSVFAGNPYLIDLDMLIRDGLLEQQEADDLTCDTQRVDYASLYQNRYRLLELAFRRFAPQPDYRSFFEKNRSWLEDYGLFMALKEKFGGRPWQQWPRELMLRDGAALEQCRRELEDRISFQYFLQYVFYSQWNSLRSYAREKGIRIIGDVPIYVPLDSADVWIAPQLFQLDENCRPQLVAGVPPDSFTAEGQLWGNPLYDWEKLRQEDYGWWIRRLEGASNMYDMIRLDHFRGFESYWAVPAGDATAANGSWKPGPAMDFIRSIRQAFPEMEFIAEDLGYLTPQVRQLQRDSGYPGMKVLQFAFDSRESSDYLPHTYTVNSVCYTGTHDNFTLAQWLEEAAEEDICFAKEYLGLNREEGYVWGMIRGCMSSVSKLCIVQLQDYLELDGSARMNFPGTLSADNWSWRAPAGCLTPQLAEKIRGITKRYDRI